MPSSTKWRLYVTAINGGTLASVSELAMRTTYGGPNACVGGTASASSQSNTSTAPGKAFDGSTGVASAWESAAGALPAWLQYEFPSAVSIVEIAVSGPSGYITAYTNCPKDFQLQYWSGSAWVPTIQRIEETAWRLETDNFSTQTRVYSARPKTEWRLYCTDNDASPWCGIAELQLRSVSGGASVATGGTSQSDSVFSTGYLSSKAFDGSSTTSWTALDSVPYPHWVRYTFPSPVDIIEYAIRPSSDGAALTPKSFKLQCNDGLGGWVDCDTRTSVPAWTAGEIRAYGFTPPAIAAPDFDTLSGSVRPQVFVCT